MSYENAECQVPNAELDTRHLVFHSAIGIWQSALN